jgi:hypothetical protein
MNDCILYVKLINDVACLRFYNVKMSLSLGKVVAAGKLPDFIPGNIF